METIAKIRRAFFVEDLPFAQTRGQVLFHLTGKLYERVSIIVTTNAAFGQWSSVFWRSQDDNRATRVSHAPL